MQKAHARWRTNIRLHLAPLADVHPRTVDHWEAGERAMSLEAFLALLDSDAGLAVLETFMSRLRPDLRQQWWDDQVLRAKIARAERRRARAEHEARQLHLELKR